MKKEQKLILTVGLPKSGKSTWAKAQATNDKNIIIVSRNDLRRMFSPISNFSDRRESLVSVAESAAVKSALSKGYDVIIDANHLNPKVIDKWIKFVEKENERRNIQLQLARFHTSLTDCIKRDENSPFEQRVGSGLIKNLYHKYIANVNVKPEYNEDLVIDMVVDEGFQYSGRTLPLNPTEDDISW